MLKGTVEYEVAKVVRSGDGEAIARIVLLPKAGEPFPRMENCENNREEIVRKHHDILKGIQSRDIQVTIRPFVSA